VTSYTDTTAAPLTSYSYTVRARDAANHVSGFSGAAAATTGDAFADPFETGDLSAWTGVSGLLVQQAVVDGGQWAAEAASDGTSGSSAQVQLDSTVPELYYRARFRVASQGTNSVGLLRFRTAQNAALASAFVSSIGVLAYRNDTTAAVTASGQTVTTGVWHEIQMHVLVADTASHVDVWLDGVQVITQDDSLGTSPIGRLELGDPSLGRAFDVAFDSVVADPIFIADTAAPTAPSNLHSTNIAATSIDLAWNAASDDVGVVTYRLRRNGTPVADLGGSTLSYSDSGLNPGTPYTYTVTALDAAGHESPLSNALQVTTSGGPTAVCWPFRSPPPLHIRRCR
jgi:chitodextrinase